MLRFLWRGLELQEVKYDALKKERNKIMVRQLRMIWPKQLVNRCPEIKLPEGYSLRNFQKGDEERYLTLMHKAGFENWRTEQVRDILKNPLSPEGIYFVIFDSKLVATACALDRTSEKERDAGNLIGELSWVACDPSHRGKHLGKTVCAAVVRHFLLRKYQSIFLLTDDWRLAAIKTYLELGFEPVVDTAEMQLRWEKVCEKLKWKLPNRAI